MLWWWNTEKYYSHHSGAQIKSPLSFCQRLQMNDSTADTTKLPGPIVVATDHQHPPNLKEQMIMSWIRSDMDLRKLRSPNFGAGQDSYSTRLIYGSGNLQTGRVDHLPSENLNLVKFSTWSTRTTSNHHFQNSQPTPLPQPQEKDQIGHFMVFLKNNN